MAKLLVITALYDWRFVDDPSYDPDLRESLKRMRGGTNWLASTGGEFRYRYQDEYHSRLTIFDNSYSLTRVRAYLGCFASA